jgi:hypothetical protein
MRWVFLSQPEAGWLVEGDYADGHSLDELGASVFGVQVGFARGFV